MKQVFLDQGKARLFETSQPLLAEKEILVEVRYSFISSGTEYATLSASGKNIYQKFVSNITLNTYKIAHSIRENGLVGTASLIKGAMSNVIPIGYSCSGVVVAVGKQVIRFKKGDLVACGGAGSAHHAQIITVPENLAVHVAHEDSLKYASITTIGAIALQSIRRAHVELGERVCVVGLGLLGQLTVQLAQLSGAKVYGVDVQEDRLKLALQHGAVQVFNPVSEDWLKSIAYATAHQGVDTTIITAGSATGDLINHAMQITRRKGKVVLVGDVKLDFDREQFYTKEIDLLISCSYGPGRYDQAYEQQGHDYPYAYVRWTENRNMELFVQLLEEKRIVIDRLIQHEFALENVGDAYEQLQKKQSLGIVLAYQAPIAVDNTATLPVQLTFKPQAYIAPRGVMKLAVIGAGGFCKVKLLPIVAMLNDVEIHTVIDTVSTNAINVARQYGVTHIGISYQEILTNKEIDAVLIATPHGFHTEQIIKCLEHGKAVFAEKPAAITFGQLEQLKTSLLHNPDSFLCVDFNRSFSPFMQQVKKLTKQRSTPLIINYRMNAGHIPLDHWTQSAHHGGRIIGEACHIFELFCFLTDAVPAMILVTPLTHEINSIAPVDNIIVTLRMSDGSVCTLTFTSTGSSMLPKEYMEVFFDGKSIIMNDYKELKGYGIAVADNQKVTVPDKGHEALIKQFFEQAKCADPERPISYERIIKATEISLIVDKLARQGGGSHEFLKLKG